ncbi:MAG: hypothetical protein DI539_24810 [Flavobacterium psychrophilum]|nr:MAG: hypothetical protein DI539_24810 [Flavobacterium psychrophilum]
MHYLDNKGRIYKTNQLALDGTVAHTTNYAYDAAGNRVTEWATYDDKVNPYRTNPVWSLIHWDYSVNNPLYFGHPLYPNNGITAYNDWGLPVKMISEDARIFGNRYDTLEIEYQCSK